MARFVRDSNCFEVLTATIVLNNRRRELTKLARKMRLNPLQKTGFTFGNGTDHMQGANNAHLALSRNESRH